MFLIAGLGNPTKQYQNTRHNIGFSIIEEFAEKNNFPDFKLSKKFNALISGKVSNNKKIILAKPQTYMNNSGIAINKIIKNYKIKIGNLIVAHDDIDLPLGKIKIVKNRGSAGHKGVESIIKEINAKDFTRFRIGIMPASGKNFLNVEKFVLQKFSKEEKEILKQVFKETINSLKFFIEKHG